MPCNCHFSDYISSMLYLHSFRLRKQKFNLNLTVPSVRVCSFLCCSKPSVVENVSSGCIIYASPCPYHRIFLVLSKMLWRKFSIIFKKFDFLWSKMCSLPSSFSFFSSLLRFIRLLIFGTILQMISLITPSSESKQHQH